MALMVREGKTTLSKVDLARMVIMAMTDFPAQRASQAQTDL